MVSLIPNHEVRIFSPHHSKIVNTKRWVDKIHKKNLQLNVRRTIGNKNEYAKCVPFREKTLFDMDWPE